MTDPRDHMSCAESSLLNLGKKFINILVELHLSNESNRQQLLWPEFGGIQYIEVEFILAGFWAHLYSKLPGRKGSAADSVCQIPPVEIWVLAAF